jgi:hypothetical protein
VCTILIFGKILDPFSYIFCLSLLHLFVKRTLLKLRCYCVSHSGMLSVGFADQKSFKFVKTVELLSLQIVLVSEVFSINSLFMSKVRFAAVMY